MNQDQINGLVRAIAMPVIAWAMAKGYLPAGDYAPMLVAIGTILTGIWSLHSNATGKTIQ